MKSITDHLRDKDAKAVWKQINPLFTADELQRYHYIIIAYCNETSLYLRLSKTNDGIDANKANQITGILNKVLDMSKELQLTPRANRLASRDKTEPDPEIELPGSK
jgi:hypothetical protein